MANFQPMQKASNLWRNNSLVQWSTGIPSAEDLIAVPSYLSPGNADEAREYYTGRFKFRGELHDINGSSPFQLTTASTEWVAEVHGFSWLRHLHKADSPLANSNAQIMVRDWIKNYGKETTGIAWAVEVIANRIIAWLAHAPMIIENDDQAFYSSFLQSITAQVRYLYLAVNSAPAGMPRMIAKIAIAYTSLCLNGQSKTNQQKQILQAANALGQELERQFYADGGHISRNPDAGISAALVLLPLHQLYLHQQAEPPIQLTNALDRILPMLEFFAHPNGSIAHFNGGGRIEETLLATVLAAGGHSGKPPENAAISGYQKMQAGKTKLIMDTGHSPEKEFSHNAHAGCLSFEMSSASNIIITNCGAPFFHEYKLSQAARSTAAHSTATLNDTSSCRFQKTYHPSSLDPALISPPFSFGITKALIERSSTEEGEQVTASHDGYKKTFATTHQRTIFISTNGETINGTDNFINDAGRGKIERSINVAIRFHLHPDIEVKQSNNAISVTLTTANGERWKFTCMDARIEIENSVHFYPKYANSKQILLSTASDSPCEIRWVIEKVKTNNLSDQRKASSDTESGDLLDIMTKSKNL